MPVRAQVAPSQYDQMTGHTQGRSLTTCSNMFTLAELIVGGAALLLAQAPLPAYSQYQAPVLLNFSPRSGPTAGGTPVSVTGEGFVDTGPGRSKCTFDDPSHGSAISETNQVHNSTHLTCVLPPVTYLPQSALVGGHYLRLSVTAGASMRSNVEQFLVFDLTQMHISAIAPNTGLNITRNMLFVYGGGYVDTGEIFCSVDGHTLVPAAFLNTTLLHCELPTHPTAAQVRIDVYLNSHMSASVQPESQSANSFTFFVTAPEIVSCEFSSSYVKLFLTFDREIEIGGVSDYNTTQMPSCNLILDNETLHLLGDVVPCSWYNSQQRTVVITLSPTSQVIIGSVVHLRGSNIRTRAVEYSRLASGSVQVSASSQALIPIPVLEAPDYIPYCGDLIVTGERSQHGGALPLEYKWLISSNLTDAECPSQDSTFQDYVPKGFTNVSALTIPSTAFTEEIVYSLQLTVKNFLGMESTALANITKLDQPAPQALILGSPIRRVIVNAEIRLEGVAVLHECLNASGIVDYSWKIGSPTGHGEIDLGFVNTETAVLVLPPFTLTANSIFVAVLTVAVDGQSSNATVRLMTETLRIGARIVGGIHRAVGEGDVIVLDGKLSEGIDQNLTDISVLWHCHIADAPQVPCADTLGSTLDIPSQLVHMIPSNTLPSSHYNFTLTLTLSNLQSIAHQTIDVLPHGVPLVSLIPSTRLESVPVLRKLILEATVFTSHPGMAVWSSEYVPGYAQLLLSTNTTRTALNYEISPTIEVTPSELAPLLFVSTVTASPFVNTVSLVLQEGTLLPGNPYRFRLEVTDTQGQAGFSEIDILTESQPLSGHLEIEPTQGIALSTKFSLRALQWTDDVGDTPLSYQFGLQYPYGHGSTYWLTGILTSNQISVVLPLACCGMPVGIVLHIFDQNAAFAEQTYSLNLSQATNQSFDLVRALQEIEEQSLVEGNWVEGLANLMSWSLSVNRCPNSFTEVQTFKRQAVDLLLTLHNSSIPSSRSYLNQLLLLLLETTSQTHLSQPTLSDISSVLGSYASLYNNGFSRTATDVELGLSRTEAEVIFATYANLILANSQLEEGRVRTDALIESLLRTLMEIGYGMCLQLGIFEEPVLLVAEDFATLKSSHINLPADYSSTTSDNESPFGPSDVVFVDFGKELFQRFLQRSCEGEDEVGRLCSGVCVTSAQFKHNLKWEGSEYSSQTKTHFLQLFLTDPQTGSLLNIFGLQFFPVELSFPITSQPSNYDHLTCVLWDDTSTTWNSEGCDTVVLDSTRVLCRCSHLAGGQITVVERCSPGHYGEVCAEECPLGLWGEECSMSCDCSGRGICSAHDGSCDCDPGWTGNKCQDVCPEGLWGESCSAECLCVNGAECSPVDGSCACQPGWIGQHCDMACSSGLFGDGCTITCECRSVNECDKVTGSCSCQAGYTGPTCHSPCPEGFYGEQCALECGCSANGTESCDNVNGTCFCRDMWEGEFCDRREVYVTTPPVPSSAPPSPSSSGFQIWMAVVPVLLGAVATSVIIATVLCWGAKRKRKKKVVPISEETVTTKQRVKDSVATYTDSDENITMTKGESYEVLVPKGARLSDMFLKREGGERVTFREPPVLSGKQRWQIIRLLPKDSDSLRSQPRSTAKVRFILGDSRPEFDRTSSMELNSGKDKDADEEGAPTRQQSSDADTGSTERVAEVVYERGVYLDSTATLKDLRNSFLDSNQLDSNDRLFQFLQSDIPGDYVDIDTEDEVALTQIQDRLVQTRTLYIEALEKGSASLELCVCGKYADLECTDCASRGYCSEKCQQNDWHRHELTCHVLSAKRHRNHKRRKHKKKGKIKKRHSSGRANRAGSQSTPSEDICICGKTAEFECSNCSKQGYCCEECQNEDWSFHQYYCEAKPELSRSPTNQSKRWRMQSIAESLWEGPPAADHLTPEGHRKKRDEQSHQQEGVPLHCEPKVPTQEGCEPSHLPSEAWTEERLLRRSVVEMAEMAREKEELEQRIAESDTKMRTNGSSPA